MKTLVLFYIRYGHQLRCLCLTGDTQPKYKEDPRGQQ